MGKKCILLKISSVKLKLIVLTMELKSNVLEFINKNKIGDKLKFCKYTVSDW